MSTEKESVGQLQALAYERLSLFFSSHQDKRIEIEILPPAFQPPDGILMEDGFSLGIPKKILALAYIEARKTFFMNRHAADETSQSDALLATKTMLLFDPEHLTAANFRKRNLLALKTQKSLTAQSVYLESVRHEFLFLDSILTSPLHRQSKSPTLWYHRLWLLDINDTDNKAASRNETPWFWSAEIDAVCRSGEQHPKNYYAWQYARRLVGRVGNDTFVCEIASRTKDWCFKHPSDISGWSFLIHMLLEVKLQSRKESLVREVLQYALNLRSENESVWIFLRTVLAQSLLQENVRVELNTNLCKYREDLTNKDPASVLSKRITHTVNWIEQHSNHKPPSTSVSLI